MVFFFVGLRMNLPLLSAMDNLDLSISVAQEEGTDTVLASVRNKGKKMGQAPQYEDQYSNRG